MKDKRKGDRHKKCGRHKTPRCRICNSHSWASHVLCTSRSDAKRRGSAAADILPGDLVVIMKASKFCIGCGGKLNWKEGKTPSLHHNHKTGEVYGFCHSNCNVAEGLLSKLTVEQRKHFIKEFFPEVFS